MLFRDNYQEQIYKNILDFLKDDDKRSLLISAPPGTGKTYITITTLFKESNGKVFVVLRTHTQQEHYKKILPQDEYIALRGMENFCKIPQVLYHPLKHQLCQWMRRMGKCKGCPYQLQFIEAKRKRVISLLYSHLSTSLYDLLQSAEIIVFDEYQHLIPNEKTISSIIIQLAEAELGNKIELNNREEITNELNTWKEIGFKIWSRRGYSYLLELANILSSLKNTWVYRKNGGLGYLDISAYEAALDVSVKKIFISATPLPEIGRLLKYDSVVEITPVLKNAFFIIFDAFSLPYYKRFDKKVKEIIIELINVVSMYRTAIFLPSESVKNLFSGRLPETVTDNFDEFINDDSKSALLIAGGRYGEAIDLPRLDIILIIGLPYEPPPHHSNPFLREVFKYYKLYNVKVRRLFYDYKALIKVVQAIGRGIRSIDQKILVILADSRYANTRIFDLFPTWLKNQSFTRVGNLDLLKKLIIRWNLNLSISDYIKLSDIRDVLIARSDGYELRYDHRKDAGENNLSSKNRIY